MFKFKPAQEKKQALDRLRYNFSRIDLTDPIVPGHEYSLPRSWLKFFLRFFSIDNV